MITVTVSYTVKPEFVAQNQQNIQRFLEDFRQLDTSAFHYSAYLMEDGVTFRHFAQFRDEAMQKQVLAVPSFRSFQQQRDESGIGDTQRIEKLQTIGASSVMF